ncbi:MAG: RNA-binding protein [Beijerinckiaceae bacterium]|nr:RNA-binding protein [Beijerinckiaceae bacterium]
MTEPDVPPAETLNADRAATTRMCAVSRAVRPVAELVRFVAGPDGFVVADIRSKLPGRGVWVSNNRGMVEQAIRRKVFARALKAEVSAPADLVDQVERLLKQDALQMLAFANKAGAVVTGFEKVEGMKGAIAVLIQARDGSESERRRLQGHLRGRGPGRGDPPLVQTFSADELALSLGREHVIHAALRSQDASSAFLARARRLDEFRVGDPAAPGDPAPDAEPAEALDFSRS